MLASAPHPPGTADPTGPRTADPPPRVSEGSEGALSPSPGTHQLRRRLYRLQEAYRPHALPYESKRRGLYGTELTPPELKPSRVAKCGRVRFDGQSVEIRDHGESCRYRGVVRCRNKACPVCIAQRRSEGATLIKRVVGLHRDKHPKQRAYLATFTLSHALHDDLKTVQRGLRKAFRRTIQGRAWQAMREKYGFSYIVGQEATDGQNGWHPHLHVLFLPKRGLNYWNVFEVLAFLAGRWRDSVQWALGSAHVPRQPWGVTFHRSSAEEYVSKLGLEMSDPGNKTGRDKGRTPLQLLEAWADDGDRYALKRYQEYESAMKGRRDLTWSTDLKELRALGKEQLDAEAKAEREEAPLVAEIPCDVWDSVRDVEGARVGLLEAAERGGLAMVLMVLSGYLDAEAALRVQLYTEDGRRLDAKLRGERAPPPTKPARVQLGLNL